MQAANDFVHEFARRFAISHPGVEVLVSDSSVHGEGEHKIMDWLRSGDDSLNHVIVGNDSDLYLLLAVSNKQLHILLLQSHSTYLTVMFNLLSLPPYHI